MREHALSENSKAARMNYRSEEDSEAAARRVGMAHEALRRAVGCWFLRRGTQRIPHELGKLFPELNANEVIASVGANGVSFPFQRGDVAHPGYWFLYEKGVRKILTRLLRPGSVFIDVGAHRGWHSGYALSLVGTDGAVIACEPHPQHAARLRMLASLNPDHNLIVKELAASCNTGSATLLVAEQEGWHTIIPEFEQVTDVPRQPINVTTSTLDDLLAGFPELALAARPAGLLVKIDAEGAELDILRGAKETLNLASIRAWIIECTGGPPVFRERSRKCIEILRERGWTPRVITHVGTRPWREEDLECQVNILAARETAN
jgi:FkbM family methyltransferase